jgi:hypothetical protein
VFGVEIDPAFGATNRKLAFVRVFHACRLTPSAATDMIFLPVFCLYRFLFFALVRDRVACSGSRIERALWRRLKTDRQTDRQTDRKTPKHAISLRLFHPLFF